MHPARLHALAALASLEAAQATLTQYARHARQAALSGADDLGTVQAWRPATERQAPRALPANPLLDAIVLQVDRVANPLLERARRTADTLAWIAGAVLGDDYRTRADPLAQLRAVVPALQTSTCETMTRWLVEQDRLVRQAAGIGDDLQLWPGVACPGCDNVVLALQMSGPAEDRVVVCTESCPCAGEACGCGMPDRAVGVAHIWQLTDLRARLARGE
ncbi:hypothetical protein [Actinoplanes sp. NPDC049599]|uniref:hypothetical protein n=1 Tax=Actinoplanes sp. NPDC049599 TaxID=3363903 RepID=UPI00379CFD36